jgi:subtilisin family serine protease
MDRATAVALRHQLELQGVEITQTFRNSTAIVGRVSPSLARALRRLPYVNYVAPEGSGSGGQGPPPQDTGWQARKVGADWVWYNLGDAGQWTTITILDSGIDSVHRTNDQLDGPQSVFVDCLYVPSAANTCYQGNYVHGSHVAGIAAARNNAFGIIGIAWNPGNLATVRICRDDGVCPFAALAGGLDWTISNGYSRQIVNISIQACLNNPTVASLVAQSASAGNLLVSIAGNTDFDCSGVPEIGANGVTYPGRYPQVLTVSGTLPDDAFAMPGAAHPEGTCSMGSRFGPEVDVSAPFWAKSMVSGGNWAIFCGTSMAAPVVTAVAAMIWSRNLSMTAAQVRSLLEASAADLGSPGFDPYFGHGRVSAYNALYVPPPPPPSLSVSISGPTEVLPNTSCSWFGSAAGGTPPYSLEWLVNGHLEQQGGEYFSWSSDWDFTITLNARDANNVAGANALGVGVSSSASPCSIQ